MDYTELINGITAKYYKLTNAEVRIGSLAEKSLSEGRYAIMQDLINEIFKGLVNLYESGFPEDEILEHGDFLNGVVHLTKEDSDQLTGIIRGFILIHEKSIRRQTMGIYPDAI